MEAELQEIRSGQVAGLGSQDLLGPQARLADTQAEIRALVRERERHAELWAAKLEQQERRHKKEIAEHA
eukprot:COSAG04_NODE_19480_length_415_cov_1.136076_2_plen_68_part_01